MLTNLKVKINCTKFLGSFFYLKAAFLENRPDDGKIYL